MEPIVLTVCLAGLLAGTYTDLRTREVPDWLNYGLIFTGFAAALAFSYIYSEYSILISSIIGFGALFLIAVLMYYTGQWGGGDSKMIMGLGALVGIPFSAFKDPYPLPFLGDFIIYTIICGAVYGLIWSSVLAVIHRKKFVEDYRKQLARFIILKKAMIILSIIMVTVSFFIEPVLRILLLLLVVIMIFTFYVFLFVRSIEKVCMLKYVEPEQLTLGDWIAEDVKEGKKVICGPKDLGIEKDQIEKLISLKKKGKIKQVLIKEGIPFVPSFLMAFVLAMFLSSSQIF